jgi:hypothetical protein
LPTPKDNDTKTVTSVSASNARTPNLPIQKSASYVSAFDAASLTKKMGGLRYDLEANRRNTPLRDSAMDDFKRQIGTLASLKNNLDVNNLGQTLAKVNAMNHNSLDKKIQMSQAQNAYGGIRSALIGSYVFDISLQAQIASEQSMIDTYM